MAILAETIIALLEHLFGSLLLSYFIYSLFRNIFCVKRERNEKGDSLLFWGSVICIFLFSIRSFCVLIFFLIISINGESHSPLIRDLIYIPSPCYTVAIFIMMLCFVFRINFSFIGNYVSYSRAIIIYLYFGIFLVLLNVIIVSIFSMFQLYDYVGGYWAYYLGIIWYMIYTISLVFLLLRKVFALFTIRYKQLIDQQMQNKSNVSDDAQELQAIATNDNDEDDIDNDNYNHGVVAIDVITLDNIKNSMRYTILICIGILSTYFTVIIIAIDIEHKFSVNQHIYTWQHIMVELDTIINAFIVFLLFTFTSTTYRKSCCLCQKCFESCCISCILKFNGDKGTNQFDKQYAKLILTHKHDGDTQCIAI